MSNVPQSPFRAPVEAPLIDVGTKTMSKDWNIHLQLTAQQLKTPANQSVPASAKQIGQNGQIAVGGGFLYVYDGSQNKWLKFAPVPF